MSVEVRQASLADGEAIRAIYNHEVLNTMVTFDLVARDEVAQAAWMDQHAGIFAVLVAVASGTVVGFASLSPYRSRPAYSTTVEDSVYVAGGHRGQGVGRALLQALLERAEAHGFHAVMARIVGDHSASIALHKSCGFEVVGIEREVGRKFGHWLDVCLMQRLL